MGADARIAADAYRGVLVCGGVAMTDFFEQLLADLFTGIVFGLAISAALGIALCIVYSVGETVEHFTP